MKKLIFILVLFLGLTACFTPRSVRHYRACLQDCQLMTDTNKRIQCQIMCKQIYAIERQAELNRAQNALYQNYWIYRNMYPLGPINNQ